MALAIRRSFSDERGPGTFHSLGALPKRKSNIPPRKPPVFHIAHDDDDDEHSSSFDEHVVVPFPRSASLPSPPSSPCSSPCSSPATPTSPHLFRGASTPILLSNGKPLKSSLKSSSSSPAMLAPHHHMHLRSRSEPSSPATISKNVHFPDKDYALATVRIFNCKARPAALSSPNGNGDETETEGEDAPSARFPFPHMPPPVNYEIDPTKSSVVPSNLSPRTTNLLLESLNLSSSSSTSTIKPLLTGSILVCNLAFEKHVAIRFTLDDWQTVSEVGAHYASSLSSIPPCLSASPSISPSNGPTSSRVTGWDRFTFTVRLEDYAPSLSTRTMWLVARYRVPSTYPQPGSIAYGPGGEWWDNNGGKNYRVRFRPAVVSPTPPKKRHRYETISVPITSPRTKPQLPTTCKEHVSGLMIPSLEIEPLHEIHRPSAPPRIGKLSLCNYVPPKLHTPLSISFPSASSPQSTSPTSNTHPEPAPSATCQLSSDEESTSPASSTLSTPTVSPTIPPRMIIGGQPATYSDHSNKKEDEAVRSSRQVHIADWEWSAPASKLRMERLARQPADIVPASDALSSPRRGLDDPLYDAFVTQWCFAQGPSPNHSTYDDGRILA